MKQENCRQTKVGKFIVNTYYGYEWTKQPNWKMGQIYE